MENDLFMNTVENFDKLRAIHATACREKVVPMYIFTSFFDDPTQNGYSSYKNISSHETNMIFLKEVQSLISGYA